MKNLLAFLEKYHNWFLLVILEVISFVLLFQYNNYQGSVWFSSANAIVGKVYTVDSFVRSFFSLTKVNEELTLRNFYLERQIAQLRRLYAEQTGDTVKSFQSQMKLIKQFEVVPAKIVSNSINKPNNLITIDKGTADGIKSEMGVVCGNGLVGVVYLTSHHFSIVMPILNVKSRISCTIRNRGYFGYLCWDGRDASIAYVEDVPRHARFNRGDWVETSGFSSIFPPGVLVGQIIEVYNSRDGLSYKLKVRLSTDFGNLRDVCVITDRSIVERMELMRAANDSLKLNVKE